MGNKESNVKQGELSQEALEAELNDTYTPSENIEDDSYNLEESIDDSYEPELEYDEIKEQTLRYITKRAEKLTA